VKRICVVTTNRADYGIYRPVLRQIEKDPALDLSLIISGAHLSPQFGLTVNEIEQDGFDTSERVELLLGSDTPGSTARAMGQGMIGFAGAYERLQPHLLLALGDRFEMHAAVAAALPFRIPVAHIAGGEITEGALDDLIRHSITKLSHLHFVSVAEYAERLERMGEERWRIHVTGTPALDNLAEFAPLGQSELEVQLDLRFDSPPLLVTLHPETQSSLTPEVQVGELLQALREFTGPIVFTYPNSDPGGLVILEEIKGWVSGRSNARIVPSLGTARYFSLMGHASAMVGNSSSGIVEAASFALPVVNIGARQRGRPCPPNILNVPFAAREIAGAIRTASSPGFKNGLQGVTNPFGDGHAGERIAQLLSQIEFDERLLTKRYQ
jgi:UDP-hydrolysing UDP-N-acetyl-D-glucosamine 2-epimerase